MTEEEYLARLGLLRPQSGKRKPQEPVPPGSSVLDVPIGGTRRIPDTVLRRQYEGPNVGEATPYDPTLRERLAAKTQDVFEGLGADRYKARQRAETILGGPSSNLPLQIGLADFAPFLGTTIQTEEAGRGLEQAGRDIQRGDYLSAGIEGLGAGLGLLPGLSATAKGAKAVGKRVREAADPEAIRQYIRQTQGLTGLPGTAAVRPKWGNWLAGSVEQATKPLQPLAGVRRLPAKDVMREMQETYPPEVLAGLSGETARVVKDSFESLKPQVAISDWIDQKLNKYIKNEMGTADDPIRKQVDEWAQTKAQLLAQKDEQIDRLQKKMVEARQARGLAPEQEAMLTRSRAELEELRRQRKYIEDQKGLHFDPYTVTAGEELTLDTIPGVVSQRTAYGFPREGLGKDPTARQWEALSDMAISDIRAGTIQNAPNTAAQLAKAEQNYQQAVDSVNDAVRARIREKVPNISERDLNISAKDFNVQKSLRTAEETRLLEDARAELFKAQNADKPKYKTMLEENPWVMGLDPETRLFERPITDELGFDHLVDELKNAMRPDSGLPSRLQLKPEDLSKMTVAKAARLVDEINAYRSGVKADADRAVASNAATVEVKSYDVIPGTDVPNTQGFAWKQIKPFQFRSEDQLQGEALEAYRRHLSLGATQEQAFKSVSDIYGRNAVQDALKYEGDILSHCVGGYCDDVLSGRSQIFSLRDANGMPAVTIETRPGRPWNQRSGFFYEHPELEQPWVEFSTAVKKQTREQNLPRDSNYIIGFPKWLSENQPEVYAKYANLFEEAPADIIQIKGKKNGPPAPEHLPFVQDFVRNGNWGSIGDFKNTGFDFPATGPNGIFDADQIKTLEANGVRVPKLLTRDEAKSLQDQLYRIETGKNPETGMAQGGLVSDPNKAAFGIYPSSGKRPERLNQSRDVNAPLQLARGWTAGLLGLPGDIEGLVRMLPGIKEETPVLPTSDFYREYLPGYDPKPFARAVSGLGALSGGYGATRVAGRVAEAAKPENIRQYVRQTQGLTGMPGAAVVKPKGGNWLQGNIEKSTEPLKRQGVAVMPLNETELADFTRQGYTEFNPSSGTYSKPDPVNTWIDKKLNKYIRNEMGTPEDPVRKLAEQGRLHFEAPYVEPTSKVEENRRFFAQENNNKWGYGQSQLAQNWEDAADRMLNVVSAESLQSMNPATFNRNWPGMEWVQKLNPETPIYGLNRGVTGAAGRDPSVESLGFPHLIDELRNATASNSDLPAHLRYKPEDLDKVTMAQAVERVSKINDWRAAQMEAAKKAAREGIPVHKQYEGGYQWMAAPDTAKDPKSLKYIQDVGCESGWCTQGESLAKQYGGSGNQLYVLHDPSGKSVVQISVRPARGQDKYYTDWVKSQPESVQDEITAAAIKYNAENPNLGYGESLNKILQDRIGPMPPEIIEIKGRQNRAPKDEYLPMVQDFVRSGKWSRVGDIQNTGLYSAGDVVTFMPESFEMSRNARQLAIGRARQAGELPDYMTKSEYEQILKKFAPEDTWLKGEKGMAAGGLVQNADTLRDKLIAAGMDPEQAMQQSLRMADQVEMAGGGLAKAAKAALKKPEPPKENLQDVISRINTKLAQDAKDNNTKPIASPAVVNSTVFKSADKIAKANPKLSEAEIAKKAERDALAKLKWERQERFELEKTYGKLEKSSYQDSRAKRLRNVPDVVEQRARAAEEFLAQPVEPWTPPESGLQAFDRSLIKDALEGFPGVEQTRFPRYQPARADLSYIDEIYDDPRNRALIEQQIKRGLPLGGETFYASLYPLKVATLERGVPASKFEQFVYETAPASARNSIMNEMAVGQFLRDMKARGLPLDEDTVTQEMAKFKSQYGTGLPLMPVHREGVRQVIEGGQNMRDLVKADIPTNYKIPTYGTQKAGDFGKSVVLDVHEAAGETQASRYHPYFTEQGGFGPTEYGLAESKMLGIAEGLGIPGGMAQAGRWFGGGELTGLKSPRGDALDLLEKQAAYTMQGMGIKPTPKNVREYVLNMIETGRGVLMPYFKSEGMPDYRVKKKDGGVVKPEGAEDFAQQVMQKIAKQQVSK